MTKSNPPPEPKDPANLVCSRCLKEHPKSEFYKTTNYYCQGRGYTYVCKTCSRASANKSARLKRETKHDAKTKDDNVHTDGT